MPEDTLIPTLRGPQHSVVHQQQVSGICHLRIQELREPEYVISPLGQGMALRRGYCIPGLRYVSGW